MANTSILSQSYPIVYDVTLSERREIEDINYKVPAEVVGGPGASPDRLDSRRTPKQRGLLIFPAAPDALFRPARAGP